MILNPSLVPYMTEMFSIKNIEFAEIRAFCGICLLNVGVDVIRALSVNIRIRKSFVGHWTKITSSSNVLFSIGAHSVVCIGGPLKSIVLVVSLQMNRP